MKEVTKITPWTGEQLHPVDFLNEVKRVMVSANIAGKKLDMSYWGESLKPMWEEKGNKEIPSALNRYEDYKDTLNEDCGYSCCMLGWCASDSFFNSMGLYLDADFDLRLLKNTKDTSFGCFQEDFTGLDVYLFWALFDEDCISRANRLNGFFKGKFGDDESYEYLAWVETLEPHFKVDHDDYVYAIDAIDYVISLVEVE
jgi:hypothetical protein